MLPARDNPFESDRIERLLPFDPAWLELSWDGILQRARSLNFRAAVVGPHGSGKTTFCDAFAPRLESAGFEVIRWFLNDRKPLPSPKDLTSLESIRKPAPTLLLIDGAEKLRAASWKNLSQRKTNLGGLIVTTHHPESLPKPRPPVLLRTETCPEMLEAFARRLAPDFDWDEAELQKLYRQSHGNLREALWTCYDRLATSPPQRPWRAVREIRQQKT